MNKLLIWLRRGLIFTACLLAFRGLFGMPIVALGSVRGWYWYAIYIILALAGAYVAEVKRHLVFLWLSVAWSGITIGFTAAFIGLPNSGFKVFSYIFPVLLLLVSTVALCFAKPDSRNKLAA